MKIIECIGMYNTIIPIVFIRHEIIFWYSRMEILAEDKSREENQRYLVVIVLSKFFQQFSTIYRKNILIVIY